MNVHKKIRFDKKFPKISIFKTQSMIDCVHFALLFIIFYCLRFFKDTKMFEKFLNFKNLPTLL